MNVCEMPNFADKIFDVVFDNTLLYLMLYGENILSIVEWKKFIEF